MNLIISYGLSLMSLFLCLNQKLMGQCTSLPCNDTEIMDADANEIVQGSYGKSRPMGLSGEHFYTVFATERNKAMTNYNYKNEGIACYVYSKRLGKSKPLYRLLSKGNNAGDHFYTTSVSEGNNAIKQHNYVYEGISCYIFDTQEEGVTVPLYRLLSNKIGDHFYTTSIDEKNAALRTGNYIFEGIAGYVFNTSQPNTTPLYRLLCK